MMNAGQVSSVVKDRAAAKGLGTFAKQLEGLDATPQQVSSSNSPPLHCVIIPLPCSGTGSLGSVEMKSC